MTVNFAEGRVTRLRREVKVILDERELPGLTERLTAELGEEVPDQTQITSVYFDRPGLPLWSRAVLSPQDCVKIRTKEYFPDVSGSPNRVVLEAKRELNGLTRKERVWLTRGELGEALRTGASGVPRSIASGAPLDPVLAVTYSRRVYQPTEDWRVTVDRDIRFYAVNSALALAKERLTAERLGAPSGIERRVVVELKFMGNALPAWLLQLAERKCERFSKFGEGMARLHSAPADGVQGG